VPELGAPSGFSTCDGGEVLNFRRWRRRAWTRATGGHSRRAARPGGSTQDPAAYAQRVVERLFPTTLPYVLDSAASFGFAGFNGRAMTDNVMNVMLSLQTNTPIDNGATVARTSILDEFPYFGAPHAHAIVD
jgi:hypothetical protein